MIKSNQNKSTNNLLCSSLFEQVETIKFKGIKKLKVINQRRILKKKKNIRTVYLSSQKPSKSFLSLLKAKLLSHSSFSVIDRIFSEFRDLRKKFNDSSPNSS